MPVQLQIFSRLRMQRKHNPHPNPYPKPVFHHFSSFYQSYKIWTVRNRPIKEKLKFPSKGFFLRSGALRAPPRLHKPAASLCKNNGRALSCSPSASPGGLAPVLGILHASPMAPRLSPCAGCGAACIVSLPVAGPDVPSRLFAGEPPTAARLLRRGALPPRSDFWLARRRSPRTNIFYFFYRKY